MGSLPLHANCTGDGHRLSSGCACRPPVFPLIHELLTFRINVYRVGTSPQGESTDFGEVTFWYVTYRATPLTVLRPGAAACTKIKFLKKYLGPGSTFSKLAPLPFRFSKSIKYKSANTTLRDLHFTHL